MDEKFYNAITVARIVEHCCLIVGSIGLAIRFASRMASDIYYAAIMPIGEIEITTDLDNEGE